MIEIYLVSGHAPSLICDVQHMSVGTWELNRWCTPCMIFHSIYGHSCGGTEGLDDRRGSSNLSTVKTGMFEG